MHARTTDARNDIIFITIMHILYTLSVSFVFNRIQLQNGVFSNMWREIWLLKSKSSPSSFQLN